LLFIRFVFLLYNGIVDFPCRGFSGTFRAKLLYFFHSSKRKAENFILSPDFKKNPAQNPKKICAENEQILRRK